MCCNQKEDDEYHDEIGIVKQNYSARGEHSIDERISFSYAGITRIRFEEYDLSRKSAPPTDMQTYCFPWIQTMVHINCVFSPCLFLS